MKELDNNQLNEMLRKKLDTLTFDQLYRVYIYMHARRQNKERYKLEKQKIEDNLLNNNDNQKIIDIFNNI